MERNDKKMCRELLEVRNFWSERNELEMRAAEGDPEDERPHVARLMRAAMVNDYRRILSSDDRTKMRLGDPSDTGGRDRQRRNAGGEQTELR